MRVILNSNIKKLGNKDDIVEVSDGYAENYLIPNNLARIASAKEITNLDNKKETIKIAKEDNKSKVFDSIETINRTIVFEEKVNDKGNLFRKINKNDIIKRIDEISHTKGEVDVKIDEVIHTPGEYDAVLKIGDSKIKIKIYVKTT